MRKYRYTFLLLFALMTALLLGGCKEDEEQEVDGRSIYYVNMDKTGLVEVPYKKKGDTAGEEVEFILKKMKKHSDSLDYQAAIPEEIKIQGIAGITNERKVLVLDFSSNYLELDHVTEVLMREAIVRSMVQIDGIDAVTFFVDQVPLKDKYGEELGEMKADNFLQNTGSALQSYKVTRMNLYFANEKGDKLVETTVKVPYNSNTSLEKVVLEQLMQGPSASKLQPTLPKELKILSVAVRDGICYVNFDETFLDSSYSVSPKITVQSIVNSIVDAGEATQVQITVNGAGDAVFQGQIPLDQPFSRDLDILE